VEITIISDRIYSLISKTSTRNITLACIHEAPRLNIAEVIRRIFLVVFLRLSRQLTREQAYLVLDHNDLRIVFYSPSDSM
jgi:hypothetical protein